MEIHKYRQPILRLPESKKVHEVEIAFFWLSDGILFTVIKTKQRSLENISDLLTKVKQLLNGSRVFLLIDMTLGRTYSQTEKNLIKTELFPFVKAIAILSASPVGKMLGQTMFAKGFPEISVREFTCVEDAMLWINELRAHKMLK
jgi:hypothetical protein